MNNYIKILILVLLLINSFLLKAKKENKTSRYSTIINSEDADLKERLFSLKYSDPNLAISLCLKSLDEFIPNSDFSNFCKHSQDVESYNCYVDYSLWTEKIVENKMNDCIAEYRIRANRFLHHMVRMLVGTMLEVSKNRISVEDFKGFFEKDASRNRIVTAPSKGLYLFKVYYE